MLLGVLDPSEHFIDEHLLSSSSDVFFRGDSLMENGLIIFHNDSFLKAFNEREKRFIEDSTWDDHCYEVFMRDFNQLFR